MEKRDNDKLKTDEAKNSFESLLYDFRDFLRDEENEKYTDELDQMFDKCDKEADWLDDAGPEVGYKEYQTRSYDLQSMFSKIKVRKQEHLFR